MAQRETLTLTVSGNSPFEIWEAGSYDDNLGHPLVMGISKAEINAFMTSGEGIQRGVKTSE
jgi:hypothetical protein